MSDNTSKNPMVEFVVSEFQRYQKFHQDRFEENLEIYDHWKSVPPKRYEAWQNAVHVPITIEAEQAITPRLFAALFPNEAPVEVIVAGPAKPEQGTIIRDMIQHQFRVSDVQGRGLEALTQCTLFGTGYVETGWIIERKWQIDPQTGERYQAITGNRPDCKSVNFFELFPHPAKLKVDDGLPIIRRRFCDAEFLKKLADNPRFKFNNLQGALDSKSVHNDGVINETDSDLKDREKYEILEYWGPWDQSYEKDNKVVTKKAVPFWIIVVNRSILVRGTPNPYNHQRPPYCRLTLFEDPNPNWFGIGIGQIGKPTQERLNKIVNQRLDNVDLVLNKQGFYNGNDTLINTKKLQISKPGQWHKVSDTVSSIRWMDTPDVTTSSYKEEELAKNDFRESTGATVPLMPTDEGQHRTAMGINLLQGAAGMRFRPILRKLETDFIQDLAMMYLTMLQQFMVLPEWIMVTSNMGTQEPIIVRPEDIQAKVMFLPTGISELMNKETQIMQLLRFKELTMNDPTVNRAEINKRIADLMGFKEIQKILVTQQPPVMAPGSMAIDQQQMMQRRMAEGASPEQMEQEMLGPPPAMGA